MTKKQIEKEKQKVFADIKYKNLTIDGRLNILTIVKSWIDEQIKIELQNKIKLEILNKTK